MRRVSCYIMSALYIAAGINHFWHREFYLRIMPPWLPWPETLVMLSGFFEIFFGVLLLFRQTRKLAAWGIIILLVAVFPANIQMMLNYLHESNPNLWLTIARLPLQIVLIWWAYTFTKN